MIVTVTRCKCRQRGAALVEFAFVLLPLLLLTFGTLVCGLVLVSQQTYAFAAQSGADALSQLDREFYADTAALCNSAQAEAVADARVSDVIGFLGVSDAEVSFADEGGRGCRVVVRGGFFPTIPLLPMPATVQGEGFAPVS